MGEVPGYGEQGERRRAQTVARGRHQHASVPLCPIRPLGWFAAES
jgi:hypothetical protein